MDFLSYKDYFQNLKRDGSLGRFGKAFATKNKFYFFDNGTGKVLECSEEEYLIILSTKVLNNI